ncbi:MAG: flagellar hook-length control protein FliK [Lachnospiraceae bacterium]|nr:flagellar hook-length control protein FliK [Lachnospiraceae bacterium]
MDNINTGYMNINSVINTGRIDSVKEGLSLDKAGLELLREMNSGDTFRGEVVDIAQNTATILIGEDARITANIDPNVNLSVGQSVLFEVNTDSDNLVSLRTLFTNIANENIANNALTQANVPINATSLALVSTLMEEGMSIDKDSLALLYRNIVSNPEIQANEIIRMKQIGLELNADNIAKFDAVYNFESKISDSINTVINQIPLELAAKADTDLSGAIKMASDFIDASTEGKTEVSVSLGDLGLQNESLLSDSKEGEVLSENKDVPMQEQNVQAEENLKNSPEVVKNIISDLEDDSLLSKGDIEAMKSNVPSVELSEQITLTNKDFDNLNSMITKDNVFGNEILDKLSNGEKIDLEELLRTFDSVLKDENVPDSLKKDLIKSELFKESLTDKFSEKWLLEPNEIKDSESLNNHYNKVLENTDKIIESMQNTVKGSETLTQTVNGFKENVQFLQTLNDLTPYVQLPVLLNNRSNTGDLYVYANKRNLLENPDNVSAVLRLDMKNLGRVEVYVKLNRGKNLSTDFTLPDEDTLLFIEKHIDMLNEKLEDLGFKVTNSFNTKSTAPEVLLEEESEEKKDAIGFYRFDVRA